MAFPRRRGVHALSVSPPPESTSKRSCAVNADERIAMLSKKKAPRGINALQDITNCPTMLEPQEASRMATRSCDSHTLKHYLLEDRPDVLQQGYDIISKFIERKTSFVVHKALALKIFSMDLLEGSGIIAACSHASKITGFNAEVIRRWAEVMFRDFLGTTTNIDDIDDEVLEAELTSNQGSHPKSVSLKHNETFRLKATEFVRSHGYVKGAPNLTLDNFIQWVSDEWGVKICNETARVWLHEMGFSYQQFNKGIYFDGHEREDVVEHRKKYLATLATLKPRFLTSPTQLPVSTSHHYAPSQPHALVSSPQHIIRVFHDESTFYANADQSLYWSDGSTQALKQKSLGQAVMVSDFIDEVNGYLKFEDTEARLYLEHQSEGYFTNDMFVDQVSQAISIFEKKYPGVIGLFIFDNAPSHCKKPDDCLNPDKMNVSNGGKQPFMRDTMWNSSIQKMTLTDGTQKGMRCVLEERGVDTYRMKADQMRKELRKFEDFRSDGVPIVEEMVVSKGHMCLFIPRFHCELNPIERCWCHAKRYTRAHCNGSIVRLRKIIPEGLATVSNELISSFFLTCIDYEEAYREGHSCTTVDTQVKKYKSHRKVHVAAADENAPT